MSIMQIVTAVVIFLSVLVILYAGLAVGLTTSIVVGIIAGALWLPMSVAVND